MVEPRWKRLGFASQQQHAAQVGANQRRIGAINKRLGELDWFNGVETEEGARLDAERMKLVDQIVDQIAPLPPPPEVP